MVFTIPAEFHAPMKDVVELALGARHAVFEKPENPSAHMKLLFIWGHLDGTPVGHMLVHGGTSINILPLSLFKKLGHIEGDPKCTNLSLSGFAGDPTEAKGIIFKDLTVGSKTMPTTFFMVDVKGDPKCTNLSLSDFAGDPTEAKGIIFKDLTVGSKTMPTTFFVVDVKGRYNMLFGRDWIHVNECVMSTLH
jgi:hypothetical protein